MKKERLMELAGVQINEKYGDSVLGNSAISVADELIHRANEEKDPKATIEVMIDELMDHTKSAGFKV